MTEEKKQKNQGRIPRKLKKQRRKFEAQSKPTKTPKEKKQKLLKKKSTTSFPQKLPKLPKDLMNKSQYLFMRRHYNSAWVNYVGIEEMLYNLGKIKEKRSSKNDKIINNYLSLFKLVGLDARESQIDEIFMLLEASKKLVKPGISKSHPKSSGNTAERKDKKKKPNKQSPYSYKWKRLDAEVFGNKTKPPIWVSEDIISQVEEKHYFISSAYREISKGSKILDFYTMQLALEEAGILTQFTRAKSQLVEKYIIFYSFVGLYTHSYDLDAKIADFEKHQRILQEEMMKNKVVYMNFEEIALMLKYFKRDPQKISLQRVLEFLRIIKSWERDISSLDERFKGSVVNEFLLQLQLIIENISIIANVNKDSTNFGKIIHLVKKLDKQEKPLIKEAV